MKAGDLVRIMKTKKVGIILEEPDSYCFIVLIGEEARWVMQSNVRLINESR